MTIPEKKFIRVLEIRRLFTSKTLLRTPILWWENTPCTMTLYMTHECLNKTTCFTTTRLTMTSL